MIPDLIVAASLVFLTGGAFLYIRWIDGPRDFIARHLISDDPFDEETGLDRLEKYGPKGRLK